jgi:phytoene dehydrogenase-like protein
VLDLVERQAPNLRDVLLDHVVLTPADLERRNVNLVGGDPYAGALSLEQHFLWRPLPSFGSHTTPVEGLFQCGAATFPGAGLAGASGRIVAKSVLRGRRSKGPT